MKKKISALLALVMFTMTASAEDAPTYALTSESVENHGTITFKVNSLDSNPVTAAKAGDEVYVIVEPNTGYVAGTVTGYWDAAVATSRRAVQFDMLDQFTPEAVTGETSIFHFTMISAKAKVKVAYKKSLQDSWIQPIAEVTYNGLNQIPDITVKDGDTVLKPWDEATQTGDYIISGSNNKDAALATDDPAPTVTITAVETSDKYAGTASKTFTIGKAKLTIKADDKSVRYGSVPPTYTATYSGLVGHDTKSVISGKLTFSCSYRQGSNTGTYTITPSGQTSNNYDITFAKGKLTVGGAYINISTSGWSGEYDGKSHSITVTVNRPSGALVQYRTSRDELYSTTNPSFSDVGTYTVDYYVTKDNYVSRVGSETVTILPANVDYSDGTITKDQNGYDISLTEGEETTEDPTPLPVSGDVDELDYDRTLDAPEEGQGEVTIDEEEANLYTVCLPFEPQTRDGVKYYTLSGVEGNTLKFDEAVPAAFTPFLVAVTGTDDFRVSCEGVDFDTEAAINSTTVDGFTFNGTLTGLSNEAAVAAAGDEGATYILQANGKWGKVVLGNPNVYLPPFRAYITGPDIILNGARKFDSSFSGNVTAVSTLRLTDADGTEHWYDLNGRRIDRPTKKGVFIHNGRKEVMK